MRRGSGGAGNRGRGYIPGADASIEPIAVEMVRRCSIAHRLTKATACTPSPRRLDFGFQKKKTVQADRQAGAGGGRVGLVRGPRPVRVTRKNLKFPHGPPAPRVPRGPRTRQIKGGYCTRPDHAQARGPRRHFFLQQTYGVTTGSRSPAVRWVSNEGAGGSGTRVRRPRFKNWARLVLYDSEAGCWSRF